MKEVRELKDTAKYGTMEASRILNVHRNTLGVWVREGFLRAHVSARTGRRYYLGRDLKRFYND